MDHLKLTVDKLSVEAISELVVDEACGAVSMFVGTTRNNFEDKKVLSLEYEAFEPMALKAMEAICHEVRQKWPAVHGIAIYHRLGAVPCREASVVIAISSPHRADSLEAVGFCIDQLKATVGIWKKEVYADGDTAWKENKECTRPSIPPIDKHLVQVNVSNEELQQRIQNFIERKREQVNINNIHDFIPGQPTDDEESCARVRTQFVRRSDSKGHLKIRKVHNEWGPQTAKRAVVKAEHTDSLPLAIDERVTNVERFLHIQPVSRDVFRRLKAMEDKMAELQAVSPEYAQFWKKEKDPEHIKQEITDYVFSVEDIAKKIDMLEKQTS